MLSQALRYLLVKEEDNNGIIHLISIYLDIALFISIFGFITSVLGWLLYKTIGYFSIISKYVWTAVWNSCTPGQQWLEISLMATSVICGILMILALQSMSELLDRGFIKFKDEIKKKDEIIKELEEKIKSLNRKERLTIYNPQDL